MPSNLHAFLWRNSTLFVTSSLTTQTWYDCCWKKNYRSKLCKDVHWNAFSYLVSVCLPWVVGTMRPGDNCYIYVRRFVHNTVNIFTLANNYFRWTYFGPTRFIHPWTTLVRATVRVSDVTDKCNSWLADVTFDWRHGIVMAVERNNQTRRIITFLRRLFARLKKKKKKKKHTSEQKWFKNKM